MLRLLIQLVYFCHLASWEEGMKEAGETPGEGEGTQERGPAACRLGWCPAEPLMRLAPGPGVASLKN